MTMALCIDPYLSYLEVTHKRRHPQNSIQGAQHRQQRRILRPWRRFLGRLRLRGPPAWPAPQRGAQGAQSRQQQQTVIVHGRAPRVEGWSGWVDGFMVHDGP